MSSIVLSIFLLSIGASFIQRTTGFGFGIFIMTMLPYLMPGYGEATTLSGLLAITRAKIRTIVMYDKRYPSVFVDEFLNPEKVTEKSYAVHPNANQVYIP